MEKGTILRRFALDLNLAVPFWKFARVDQELKAHVKGQSIVKSFRLQVLSRQAAFRLDWSTSQRSLDAQAGAWVAIVRRGARVKVSQ